MAEITQKVRDEVLHISQELVRGIVRAEIIYYDEFGRSVIIQQIPNCKPGLVITAQVPRPEDVRYD